MKKINAHTGSIRWNGSVYDPKLIICFRRNAENYDNWYEIHIKLTPDVVREISVAVKKIIIAWWQYQKQTIENIQEHLKL